MVKSTPMEAEPVQATAADLPRLVQEIRGRTRRVRQNASHAICELARRDPTSVVPFVDDIVEAISKPEAQTRWQIVETLLVLMNYDVDVAIKGFEGVEDALFDEDSGLVRVISFRYFADLARIRPDQAQRCWVLLDEALQCYHGDLEFDDMLKAVYDLAADPTVDPRIKRGIVERMDFDAKSAKGNLGNYARSIIEAASL